MRGNYGIGINIWRAESPAETKRTLDMLRRAVLLGLHGDVRPIQGCAGNSVHRRRHDRPLGRLHPYGHRRGPRPDGHPRNRTGLGPRAEKDRPRARHHGIRDRCCPGRRRLYIVSPIVTSIGYQANAQFVLTPLALLAAVLVIVFVKSDRKTHEVRLAERAAQDAAEAEGNA